MNFMKPGSLFLLLILASPFFLPAQSKTTEALDKQYDSKTAFFYHNTLRMMNQSEDPAFDALIKDIEKVKFLMIRKDAASFDYRKVVAAYKSEAFEEAMSSRHEGKNFDVFLKENNSKTSGMLVLVNDTETFIVLDIVGSIALDQVTNLYNTMGKDSHIENMMKDLLKNDKKD